MMSLLSPSKLKKEKNSTKSNSFVGDPRMIPFNSESSTKPLLKKTEEDVKISSIDSKEIKSQSPIKQKKVGELTTFSIFLTPFLTKKTKDRLISVEFSIKVKAEMKTDRSLKEYQSTHEHPLPKNED